MILRFTIFFLFLLPFGMTFAQNPLADKSLPDINLKSISGESINLEDLGSNGKITVISFWAVWCIPCLKELENLSALAEDWEADYNVEIIAISTDDARTTQKVKAIVQSNDWPYQVLLDPNGELKRLLGFQLIPHTLLVDADGQIVYVHSGYVEGDEYELEDQIIAIQP